MKLTHKEFLARGKRGVAYTALLDGKRVLVKEHRDDCAIDTIGHEALFLQRLNAAGIGPAFIAYEKKALVREMVDGQRIGEFLDHASQRQASAIVRDVLRQCHTMDELGINKLEMTNPYKHILVRKSKPVMIDFERCKTTASPKNVTQFVQYLCRLDTRVRLYRCGVFFVPDQVKSLAAEYKRSSFDGKHFDELLAIFSIRPLSFSERVYQQLAWVPKGMVTTYRDLALAVGCRNFRAVGQAMRRNPYAPAVPCHRVVANDGSLGGFRGERNGPALAEKRTLLEKEGIQFKGEKIAGFPAKRFIFSSSS